MTREVRTIFLSTLTLIVYAVSMFISDGSFVFPFPLNEFIFLAVTIQFFFWNRKQHPLVGILAVSAGICAVLSTQFFWTFIYGPTEMESFTEKLTTDYLLLAFYGLVFIGGIATMIKQKKGIPLIFGALFLVAFVMGVFLNNPLVILLGYGCMIASTQIQKTFAPYHLLWVLLFVLKLSEGLTIYLVT